MRVLFSGLPKTSVEGDSNLYWDVASFAKVNLSHSIGFIKGDNPDGMGDCDALVIFPEFTLDRFVTKKAGELGVPVISLPRIYVQAIGILRTKLEQIESQKNPVG